MRTHEVWCQTATSIINTSILLSIATGCGGTQEELFTEPVTPTPEQPFNESCYRCHGDSLSPAPPRALGGSRNTSDMGVGAHRSHLALGLSTSYAPVLCDSCHQVPTEDDSPGHIDDSDNRAELRFGAIAAADGAEPIFNGNGTCSNVYCHGATLAGGSIPNPVWNVVDGTQSQCGACHGVPPPAPHPVGGTCGSCHPTMSPSDNRVFLDPLKHINGILEVTGGGGGCDSCHGSSGNPAPPRDLDGNSDRLSIGVGAHREHLSSSDWRREISCSNCHHVPTGFSDPQHVDGDNIAEVPFDGLNPVAKVDHATGRCSSLYCHGNGRDNNGSIDWTEVGAMGCESCHSSPQPGWPAGSMSGEHDEHIQDVGMQCSDCHEDVVSANRTIISAPLHINGQKNVSISSGGQWNPANQRCSNLACHESESWWD